jgi:RNA:NAD 2'-phosphotransferase (TPT1/KptA family)
MATASDAAARLPSPKQRTAAGKQASYLLRHDKAFLTENADPANGFFVPMDALKTRVRLAGPWMCDPDPKGKLRFELSADGRGIRALAGHSENCAVFQAPLEVEFLGGLALHNTTFESRGSIARGGLRRMARTHVHMTQVGDADQSSSAPQYKHRPGRTLRVIVDVERARKEHELRFAVASNGVVLCEGPIPPDCLTFSSDGC